MSRRSHDAVTKNPTTGRDGTTPGVPLSRRTAAMFFNMLRNFGASEVGLKAKLGFAFLLGLLLAINGLNVVNSYVGRDFMTAIEQRSHDRFVLQALLYVAVFAASTVVAVVYRFTEERLALLWRKWLTRRLVSVYMDNGIYYRISQRTAIANPDQRIADDVRALTGTSLSFLLMVANGTMTIFAFSGVLWSISPALFAVSVGYAAVGSLFTVLLGRRLVPLGYAQADREADLRAGLVHVRENAESIFLGQREGRLRTKSLRQVDALVANARRMIAVNRNLGFFTTGYSYMIQILPALIIAPLFIRGECEFGVIPQSAMAFSHLLGAFSLIVNQFQQISSYTVVLARVGALGEEARALLTAQPPAIALVADRRDELAYESLTLDADDGTTLVRDLSVTIPRGLRVLVTGANAAAKSALLRATAGVWGRGSGKIALPPQRDVLFVPERPYLPPATLREVLVRTSEEARVADARLVEVLASLGLESVAARAGGFDTEQDWDDLLPLRELQLLVIARVLVAAPVFVLLERIDNTLDARDAERVLLALDSAGIAAIVLGDGESTRPEIYDALLELGMGGQWSWKPLTPKGRSAEQRDEHGAP